MQQINESMSLVALTSILLFFTFTTINAQTPAAPLISYPTPTLLPLVQDTDGNSVKVGVSYHALPVLRGAGGGGGGLALGPNRNHTKICPLSVVRSRRLESRGLPISFFPVHINYPGDEEVVRGSTDHRLVFNSTRGSVCGGAAMWRRGALDKSVGKYFITTTSSVMTTDMENRFKIEFFGRIGKEPIYKLSYCPTVCSTCEKALCKDIGVHSDDKDGFQRLALTNDSPIVVRFKKA